MDRANQISTKWYVGYLLRVLCEKRRHGLVVREGSGRYPRLLFEEIPQMVESPFWCDPEGDFFDYVKACVGDFVRSRILFQ